MGNDFPKWKHIALDNYGLVELGKEEALQVLCSIFELGGEDAELAWSEMVEISGS